MELPNRDLIVDTFIPIRDLNLDAYISQLRSELIPEIRKLLSEGKIIWYGFLIHDQKNLGGRVPSMDQNLYIHIRLSLPENADINQFIHQLPSHFQQPIQSSLSLIGGIDPSVLNDQNWLYAWKVHGEASEWILRMVESHTHDANVPIQHIIQFMHYITNPLMIGHKCLFIPHGFMSF
jgi:hypothetical protein